MAFVESLIGNDEKVAPHKKNIYNSRLRCKCHSPFETKMAKIDTLLLTETAKKPYPLWPQMLL